LDFHPFYHFYYDHGRTKQIIAHSNPRLVELFVYDESASTCELDLLHHLVVVGIGDLLLIWT
jgi:hypothetical protein